MRERNVEVGNLVEPGTVLAMLDSEDQQDAVRKAEANLFAARANLDNAIANRDRTQSLYPRTATRQALDAAIAQANTAEASVNAAEAALRVYAAWGDCRRFLLLEPRQERGPRFHRQDDARTARPIDQIDKSIAERASRGRA
ncbi:biotin/lipoyl-binding protein [Rhizobium sp. ARZ01]|uniref:biotin/lipoyl-binding protein n=1 Tax=Rhizobium sp. ARZ01 TaxID=2769313 RepID=UPI0032B2F95D